MPSTDYRYSTIGWKRMRLWVIERDRGLCQMHGADCRTYATEADHIVAIADGGDFWDPNNLRAACAMCNRQAGAEISNRKRRGGYRTGVALYPTRM